MRHICARWLGANRYIESQANFRHEVLFWLHWYRWVFISILFSFQLFVQPYKILINKTNSGIGIDIGTIHPPECIRNLGYLFAWYLSLYRSFISAVLHAHTSSSSLGTRNLSTDIKVSLGIRVLYKSYETMNLVVANINFKRITWNSTENS